MAICLSLYQIKVGKWQSVSKHQSVKLSKKCYVSNWMGDRRTIYFLIKHWIYIHIFNINTGQISSYFWIFVRISDKYPEIAGLLSTGQISRNSWIVRKRPEIAGQMSRIFSSIGALYIHKNLFFFSAFLLTVPKLNNSAIFCARGTKFSPKILENIFKKNWKKWR